MTACILDTSREEGFIALSERGKLLDQQLFSSKNFVPILAEFLARHPEKSLSYLAVGTGPGSYIGTRSGVAFAKAYAYAKEIPLLGFYSPLAYLPVEEGDFLYLFEEKKGPPCILRGSRRGLTLVAQTPPQTISEQELSSLLQENPCIARSKSSALLLPPLLSHLETLFLQKQFDPQGEVAVSYF